MSAEEFGDAYVKAFNRTVRLLVSRGVPLSGAEEASQAAWARGWEFREQLRNRDFLTTWINQIAINYYRRMQRQTNREEPIVSDPTCAPVTTAAVDVEKILSLCEEPHRTLLSLQLAGRTMDEIASELGTSNLAVRVRLTRARRRANDLVQSSREVQAA